MEGERYPKVGKKHAAEGGGEAESAQADSLCTKGHHPGLTKKAGNGPSANGHFTAKDRPGGEKSVGKNM